MKTITKSVRIPDDLVIRLDAEALSTGRTRNAELVALLEESIIEMKYTPGYSLTDPLVMSQDEAITISGGGAYQIRIPRALERAIANDVPEVVECSVEGKRKLETFSEKIRYLIMLGLSTRGTVIRVELETIRDGVYHDKEIDGKFNDLKLVSSEELSQMFLLAKLFKEQMVNTDGHVLVYGMPGTGKSFCTGYLKAITPGECHFIKLMPHGHLKGSGRRVILFWSNEYPHKKKKTLILDDGHCLDNEHLLIFLKKSIKKNVRVIITAQDEHQFDENVLQSIDMKMDFNWNAAGESKWLSSVL
ncbi:MULTISPECIES: hypothetical protein [unclassified Providencia]|uniref:hypothetical protein n=1 Tax=Providencia TaxID=586 RepID=UPI00234A4AD8|nr:MULTISPECIES: hypothetical protein [unclassified Providencia]